ncbi:hypothetical protein TUBRATIS_10460 [Tubulinosema ratisbonensis]|uniref:Uncharacterized protein n=1 Tax=Tubulinosema ratisbonensis TaxID=291195 RepID=A0A437AN09_9MICR|nr:hypothetical protein TUBRATIS_10460 [Tubulinosema ratisbonensis]
MFITLFLLTYALDTTLLNKPTKITVRNKPFRRFTLDDSLKLKNSDDKVKILQADSKSYYLTINKKVICHLTDNTVNVCKNGFNRSKNWEIIPLRYKGYLIRSYTKNSKSDRLCMKHDEMKEGIVLDRCDKYDDSLRWDVGENDFMHSGYEIK